MAILLDMTSVHVPVLAGELIDLTAPTRGETAVDCTFGAGGHARLVADRLGSTGTLVCIDRDPAAEARFDELAAEVACETRFLRMDYAEGLAVLVEEGLVADVVYLDLGISSMQVDARERGFSYSYDAPLDMRMDPSQELDARVVLNDWDERQLAQIFRRYGEDPNARRIAREIVRRRRRAPLRDHRRAGRGDRGGAARCGAAQVRRGAPGQARLPGGAHRRQRGARLARPRAAAGMGSAAPRRPPGGDLLPLARGPARQALPRRARARLRVPARLPRLRLRPRARGRAAHRARRGAHPRRGRAEPARQVGPPASRPPHPPGEEA